MNVLLVEDDDNLSESILYFFNNLKYDVKRCINGIDAILNFKIEKFDLVILDLNLPDINGREVCKYIRKQSEIVPIIIISANSDMKNKLELFSLGITDYMIKPIDINELNARINVHFNINKENNKFLFDQHKDDFYFDGKKIDLTYGEYRLLKFLYKNKNKKFDKQELCLSYDINLEPRTITNIISSLRKKLKEDKKNPKYLKTLYNGLVWIEL